MTDTEYVLVSTTAYDDTYLFTDYVVLYIGEIMWWVGLLNPTDHPTGTAYVKILLPYVFRANRNWG